MDEHPKVGIAGSRLEMPDGQVHVSAFRYHTIANEFDRGLRLGFVSRLLRRWSLTPPPPEDNREADWVAGASMIVRRKCSTRSDCWTRIITPTSTTSICACGRRRPAGRRGTSWEPGDSPGRVHDEDLGPEEGRLASVGRGTGIRPARGSSSRAMGRCMRPWPTGVSEPGLRSGGIRRWISAQARTGAPAT